MGHTMPSFFFSKWKLLLLEAFPLRTLVVLKLSRANFTFKKSYFCSRKPFVQFMLSAPQMYFATMHCESLVVGDIIGNQAE